MLTHQNIISDLELQKHPEGGYYKEVYRSEGIISKNSWGDDFEGNRNYCTSIYFLLTGEEFSAFHKIKSDELWYFHAGSAIEIFIINLNSELRTLKLGQNFEKGEQFQGFVPANCWFASRVIDKESYALVSCSVSPGFDFADFELGKRDELVKQFPQHQQIITDLTRS